MKKNNTNVPHSKQASRFIRSNLNQEQFNQLGELLILPDNYIVAQPGDAVKCCYYVLEGRIRATLFSPNGVERILYYFEEDSLFLEPDLLTKKDEADIYFITETPVKLRAISYAELMEAMQNDFRTTENVILSLCNIFYSAMFHLEELYSFDSTWQICNLLLVLADEFGIVKDQHKIRIGLKISQATMANMLGMNRTTVVRIIQSLKELDLIEQTNGYYVICDLERLADYRESL